MALELRQLRQVLALAQHGSVGRAAIALNMTQPALTRSLKLIEWEVGSVLFERSAKGVMPTNQGRLVIQRAREVVDAADGLDREVLRQRVGGSDQLNIGAGTYSAGTVVAAALAGFLPDNKSVRTHVVVRGNFDELPKMLRAGQLELLVVEFSTLEGQADLEIQPLTRHQAYFVARKGHPLAGKPFAPEAVFNFPFVAMTHYPPRALQPLLAARQPVDSRRPGRPFPTVECASAEAAKTIVADSDGIAAFTLPLVDKELQRGEMEILGTAPWTYIHYAIVTLKNQTLSASCARFIRALERAEESIVLAEAALAKKYLALQRAARQPARKASRR